MSTSLKFTITDQDHFQRNMARKLVFKRFLNIFLHYKTKRLDLKLLAPELVENVLNIVQNPKMCDIFHPVCFGKVAVTILRGS